MSATSNHNVSSSAVGTVLDRWARGVATRLSTARWPMALVGFPVVAAATWWVTNSAIFDLRAIHIEGNRHLSKAQVARVGQLTSNVNVLWTLPGTIERRLERHPWIKQAHVSRTLPSALTVVIRERRPVAVLPASGAVLAPDGKVLGRRRETEALPAISAQTLPIQGGATAESNNGLAVARTMPAPLRRLVEDISMGENGRIELRLRDGTRVLYGERSEMRVKAAVLRAILQWAARNEVEAKTIDVSVPATPSLVPSTRIQPSA